MVLRVKTKWHKSSRRPVENRTQRSQSMEDRASVIGFNIWKIAFASFKNMEEEGFRFGEDEQVISVLNEVIAFLLHVTDRLVHGQFNEDDRRQLINAVGKHLAQTIQSNMLDIMGEGDYIAPFLEILNTRLQEYARFEFAGVQPGYAFLRYLGERVSEAMTPTANKWVIEHVMEVEAPEALKHLNRVVADVLG